MMIPFALCNSVSTKLTSIRRSILRLISLTSRPFTDQNTLLFTRFVSIRPMIHAAITRFFANLCVETRVRALTAHELFIQGIAGDIHDMILLIQNREGSTHQTSHGIERLSTGKVMLLETGRSVRLGDFFYDRN